MALDSVKPISNMSSMTAAATNRHAGYTSANAVVAAARRAMSTRLWAAIWLTVTVPWTAHFAFMLNRSSNIIEQMRQGNLARVTRPGWHELGGGNVSSYIYWPLLVVAGIVVYTLFVPAVAAAIRRTGRWSSPWVWSMFAVVFLQLALFAGYFDTITIVSELTD